MGDAAKPYQPGSGTEGELFFDSWCRHCERDKSMNGAKPFDECDDNELCDIIARSMAFSPDVDDEYPREWIYGEHGPCCTAFLRAGDEVKHRCELTADMFAPVNAYNRG